MIFTKQKRDANRNLIRLMWLSLMLIPIGIAIFMMVWGNIKQVEAWDAQYRLDASHVSYAINLHYQRTGFWPVTEDGESIPQADNATVMQFGIQANRLADSLEEEIEINDTTVWVIPDNIWVALDKDGTLITAVRLTQGELFVING